ncbi:MAG: NAD(P)-binding domain-containing protein, partial [Kofleriaceae bacterium]
MDPTGPFLIALVAAVLLGMGAVLDDRRARYRRKHTLGVAPRGLPLLHSLNNDRCIGCEACIDVCPTEVLDLVDHKVSVARFGDCVQCEQCANVCPTQALVMYREGGTPRMLTVPELDEHFQTGVPGQYLIGEVAGKPLVKNAANLGRAVIEHIARTRSERGGDLNDGVNEGVNEGVIDVVIDVVIVGSGPGGLSAGLACIKHRLSCLVLEKEHVISSTVARYPKGKHFMAEPCASDNVSFLPVFDGSKEQLVAAWKHVIEGAGLPIKLGEAVEQIQRGDDGVFTIKTTVATYRARTVVLATGLRGKPRLLTVPGANLEKVQPLLDDPAAFAGDDVLVVGGGDSAVEGAIALVEVGARVTLSYRGDGFKRCKQGNQKRLAELVAEQRLAVLLSSSVKWFTRDDVTITLADGSETTFDNQRAFVLIGADTPVAWLEANHVRFVERPHLYALGSTEDVVRRYAPAATPCPPTPGEALAILLDR